MKIIDLLNKIANGEEVPEKIRFEGRIFEKQEDTTFYCTGIGIFENAFVLEDLNKEVEIIEEDKKIEKLDIQDDGNAITLFNDKEWTILDNVDVLFGNKINELIDKVNSLENKQ